MNLSERFTRKTYGGRGMRGRIRDITKWQIRPFDIAATIRWPRCQRVVSGTLRSGRYDSLIPQPPYGGRDVKWSYQGHYEVADTTF